MLKKIMGVIRRKLLKVDWVKREVEAYQLVQKKQHHHEQWAQLMHTGRAVREFKSAKLDPFDTLSIVTDDGLVEEYMNGRVVGQGYVTRGDGGNSEEDSSASVCSNSNYAPEPVAGVGADIATAGTTAVCGPCSAD